jgi:hypothetical protein
MGTIILSALKWRTHWLALDVGSGRCFGSLLVWQPSNAAFLAGVRWLIAILVLAGGRRDWVPAAADVLGKFREQGVLVQGSFLTRTLGQRYCAYPVWQQIRRPREIIEAPTRIVIRICRSVMPTASQFNTSYGDSQPRMHGWRSVAGSIVMRGSSFRISLRPAPAHDLLIR